jgi:hypothetical protein
MAVNLNEQVLQQYLNGEHGVSEGLRPRAEKMLAAAQADPHDDTGAYQAGLHIEEIVTPEGLQLRVVSGDWKGFILEAECGILARSVDAAR